MKIQINRRRHERFDLDPGYTAISVRTLDSDEFTLQGHAYDISEGGIQFELDHPIDPGTTIAMQIFLPPACLEAGGDFGPGRAIFAVGNVVWADVSEPGPARMAMAVTRYCRAGDRERLLRQLATGRYRRAA